tara:strand:+ start:7946 stop:8749 length:804 start_codon:yes stop_codon:yes gene_type:complete
MAARLIDEREEAETELKEGEEVQSLEQQETLPEQAAEPEPEEELPAKYQGKSLQDVVQMHQEAEKALGRQSGEVGELRQVVDQFIQSQTQLTQQNAPQQEPTEEVDFFTDPEQAVSKAIENHPSVKQTQELNQQLKAQNALAQLQQKHPDIETIMKDPKFVEWVKGSKIRTQLLAYADQAYDFDSADELFTTWKERQQVVTQTAEMEKQGRKKAVKAASTGNTRGSNPVSKKIYRRADIIKLMRTDPDRYQSLSEEILTAYKEGRVR